MSLHNFKPSEQTVRKEETDRELINQVRNFEPHVLQTGDSIKTELQYDSGSSLDTRNWESSEWDGTPNQTSAITFLAKMLNPNATDNIEES